MGKSVHPAPAAVSCPEPRPPDRTIPPPSSVGGFHLDDVVWRRLLLTGGTDVHVPGEPAQIQQVVMNLVQNACDATAGQHPALLEIRGQIAAAGARREVVLDFHDNGSGIEDRHLPHIFDPFFTTKPVGSGTGLGLSISYGIVERHGGRLTAGNHPRGGACFTLRLPLAD